MSYGAIRHRTRGGQAVRAYIRQGPVKKVGVQIRIWRWQPGLRRIRYSARACFFPGWKVGDSYRRADNRLVALNVRRRRMDERCGDGEGTGPTQAVKRALAALSKKKL